MRRLALFATLALLAACDRRPEAPPEPWKPELQVLARTPEGCTIYATSACEACEFRYSAICPVGQNVTMSNRR